MNAALIAGAGIAVGGFVLTLLFLPNRLHPAKEAATTSQSSAPGDPPGDAVKSGYEQSVTRR
jgi:hypothetical protein